MECGWYDWIFINYVVVAYGRSISRTVVLVFKQYFCDFFGDIIIDRKVVLDLWISSFKICGILI